MEKRNLKAEVSEGIGNGNAYGEWKHLSEGLSDEYMRKGVRQLYYSSHKISPCSRCYI